MVDDARLADGLGIAWHPEVVAEVVEAVVLETAAKTVSGLACLSSLVLTIYADCDLR